MDYLGGAPAELFRVYVATDRDCVNIVYTGAVVGSPAYAPRTTGPLQLPPDSLGIEKARTKSLETGNEPPVLMVDGTISVTNETTTPAAGATPPAAGATPPAAGAGTTPATTVTAAKVDLPDTAWPTGGYYWTVVPVVPIPQFPDVIPLPGATIPVEYRETELPQDVCQSGRVMRFGKATPPVVTTSRRPYATGLCSQVASSPQAR